MKRKKICFLIGILLMLLLTLTNTAYASSRISAYSLDEEEESFFDVAQYSSRDGISTYAASGNNQNIEDDSNITSAMGSICTDFGKNGYWYVGLSSAKDVTASIYKKTVNNTDVYTLYLAGSGRTQNSAIKDISRFS